VEKDQKLIVYYFCVEFSEVCV